LEPGLQIRGTVRNQDDEPVAGIQVGGGLSDASGHYAWGGLRPGTYTLFVSAPANSNYLGGPWVDGHVGEPEEEGTPVTVDTADVDGIDVRLATGLRISGHVETARPGPVEADAVDGSSGRVVADSQGNFVIRGLRPGTFHVFFRRPVTGGILTEGGGFPLGEYPSPVELTTDNVALNPVVLPRGTDIVGSITD